MIKQWRRRRAETALALALRAGDETRLCKLLTQGADPNQTLALDSEIQRPLLLHALDRGLVDFTRLLLDVGATCPPAGSSEESLLTGAIRAPSHGLKLLTLLLQAGLDPNAGNGQAFFAAQADNDAAGAQLIISRLMEYGGQINCRSASGDTPIRLALLNEQTALVGTLVSAGATLPDDLDQLPCSEAIKALARRNADDLRVRQRLQQPT